MRHFYLNRRRVAFNNEPPVVPPAPPPVPPTPPVFTPEQQKVFDNALAVERRKGEEKNSNLIKQLETLTKGKSLSEEEKAAAQAQIEALRTEYMTKEQLAADGYKKRETELSAQAKAAAEERDSWKNVFQSKLAEVEILKAANNPEAEAYDKDQMLEFLQPKAKVTPKVDSEGKPIPGQFAVKIPITVTDDKGITKTLEMEPLEALKQLQEMPRYQNLFKSKIKGGLGGNNQGSGNNSGNNPTVDTASDPEKWKEFRKSQGYEN